MCPGTRQGLAHNDDGGSSISDLDTEEDEEYTMEKITAHRGKEPNREFKIKWVGYKEQTWEPEANILDKASITEYFADVNKKVSCSPVVWNVFAHPLCCV